MRGTDLLASAADCASTERDALDRKAAAFDAFLDRVSTLSPAESTEPRTPPGSRDGQTTAAASGSTDSCRALRSAFAETVQPESVADVDGEESLLTTIRRELGDDVAAAVAPGSDAPLSPPLKQAVVRESEARLAEIQVFSTVVDRELAALEAARTELADAETWLVAADQTPLPELGLDALRRRHQRLAAHRETCSTRLRDRQQFLRAETSGAGAALSHRDVVAFLYSDLPVDHPVLTAFVWLDETCRVAQRRVREYVRCCD